MTTQLFIESILLLILKLVNYCSSCLYDSNHPFGLSFQSNICSGCFTHKEKYTINWEKKYIELVDFIAKITKKSDLNKYNCIVPIQGDAEDYYVVENVLSLGLRPLLVHVNDHFSNNIGWHNLHNLMTTFDLDCQTFSPEINSYKELVKSSIRKYRHVLWPAIALRTSYPVHVAKERNIQLIIWGQNQAIEQVGKFSHYNNVQMSKWSRLEHDLFSVDCQKLIGNGTEVEVDKLHYYNYPLIRQISTKGIVGIYLSNYLLWDPLLQNSSMTKYGFMPQKSSSTFDPFERAGSSVYYGIHDLFKYMRCGYRKCTDHLSREIRHKRLDRNTALELNKHFTSSLVNLNPFFDWLGLTSSGKEFLKIKLLQSVSHLIEESKVEVLIEPKLPKKIKDLLPSSFSPSQEFCSYFKGI